LSDRLREAFLQLSLGPVLIDQIDTDLLIVGLNELVEMLATNINLKIFEFKVVKGNSFFVYTWFNQI
jgi:hypothetical protein